LKRILTQIKQKPTADTEDWDIIISARRSLWHFPLWELRRFSDLIRILVRRDFVAEDKVRARYSHSLQNLPAPVRACDVAYLIDNTHSDFKIVAEKRKKLVWLKRDSRSFWQAMKVRLK